VNKLLSNLWGVSERVIRRWASSTRKSVCPHEETLTDSIQRLSLLQQTCEEMEVGEKIINGFDSPKATQKRRVEERSPFSTRVEKCKQSSLLKTPIDIKALKSHLADSQRKPNLCSVEDLTTSGIVESPDRGHNPNGFSFQNYHDPGIPKKLAKDNSYKEMGKEKRIPKSKARRKTFFKLMKTAATVKFYVTGAKSLKPAYSPSCQRKDERTIQTNAEKIADFIALVCENNPNTSGRSLATILSSDSHHLVKVTFENEYMTAEKTIISGIKSFLSDHSSLPEGGTRQTASQNAIDAVMLAAVWNLQSTSRMGGDISRMLDVRRVTTNDYINRANPKVAA